jgi:hypothetical protein
MSEDQHIAPFPQQQYTGPAKGSNGLAVAGFILALLGALGSWIPIVNLFGDFLAFLGLIFGIVGLVKSRSGGAGKGLSIAAIVLAVAAFVISFVINAVVVKSIDSAVKNIDNGQKTAAKVTGKLGQPVKDGQFTFVVHSVRCGKKTSGGSLPSKPQGEFCAVSITVSNHAKAAKMFNASQVQGFIAGNKYSPDFAASAMANPSTDNFLSNINPGNSVKAIVLFDVPAGKQLDTVEVHDSLLSEGTSVSVR